jgi:hypothetical protein
MFVRSVEGKGDMAKHPEYLKQAFDLGVSAAATDKEKAV